MIDSKTQVTWWATCDKCGRQMFVESSRLPRRWHHVTMVEADKVHGQDLCPDCLGHIKEQDMWEGINKISFKIGDNHYGKG